MDNAPCFRGVPLSSKKPPVVPRADLGDFESVAANHCEDVSRFFITAELSAGHCERLVDRRWTDRREGIIVDSYNYFFISLKNVKIHIVY